MRRTGTFPATAIFCKRLEQLRSLRSLWRLRQRSPVCGVANFPRNRHGPTLRAVGTGYLKFALAETGLFRTAFSIPDRVEGDVDAAKAGKSGLNPFQLLSSALDLMVQAGALPRERRPGAEYLAWSAVHGLAFLIIEGPLSRSSRKEIHAISERLLRMVEQGL